MSNSHCARMHYNPRMLLDHFRGSNGKVWQYDIKGKSWWETSARNVGYEYNLYPAETDKKLGQEIESSIGEVFKKIRNGETNLSVSDRLQIASFISMQVFRTPDARDNRIGWDKTDSGFLLGIMQEINDFIETTEISSGQVLPREVRKHWDEWVQLSRVSPEQLLEQRGWEDPFELILEEKFSPNFPAHDVAFFMQLAWRIIYADKERYLTSDKPVEMWPMDIPGMERMQNSWFECVLPISKEVAIHLGRYGESGVLYEPIVNDNAVKILNLRRVAVANRYIYSSRKESWTETPGCRPENLQHLRFLGYPLIDIKFGQSFCPNCGKGFSQEEWAPLEAKFRYILELRGFPQHSCIGLT